MPRAARRKSETNIYHIMIRGINRQHIFVDDEDNKRFIDTLAKYRRKVEFELYAYCLMGNHIHLLIREGNEALSNTMRRIGASYVYWYNWQYDRKGHLFQDRYKSEPVEDDPYFLTVLRYIHQNPLKAGITNHIEQYKWSSYQEYVTEAKIVAVDFALALFAENREQAIEGFRNFNLALNNDQCLDMSADRKTLSDKMISELVLNQYKLELASLPGEELETQVEVLKNLKGLEGASLRQLSRLTGFTESRIYKH